MDDETILSYGTMLKLVERGFTVYLATICGRGRPEKERSEEDLGQRRRVFVDNIHKGRIRPVYVGDFNDRNVDWNAAKGHLQEVINDIFPRIVVTHSPADNHLDHRETFRIMNDLVRPFVTGSSSTEFYTTLGPVSDLGGAYGSFRPDTFVNISGYVVDKTAALKKYMKCMELPNVESDGRSHAAILQYNCYLGSKIGVSSAEAYQTMFRGI